MVTIASKLERETGFFHILSQEFADVPDRNVYLKLAYTSTPSDRRRSVGIRAHDGFAKPPPEVVIFKGVQNATLVGSGSLLVGSSIELTPDRKLCSADVFIVDKAVLWSAMHLHQI